MEQTDHTNPVFQCRNIKPQNLWLQKSVGVAEAGETPSLTGEVSGDTHRILECAQTHPPEKEHQKSTISLWVAGEATKPA